MISLEFVIESALCQILFYGFYWLFLKKETCFQWNRIYLLLTPVFSVLIPMFYAPDFSDAATVLPELDPLATSINMYSDPIYKEFVDVSVGGIMPVSQLILGIYMLGVTLFGLKLIWGLYLLLRIMVRGRTSEQKDYYLIEHNVSIPMSSFFRYIFWDHPRVDEEQEMILEHELVHVRQRHSLDRLWMEGWKIIFWWHPISYLMSRSLREVHEYIADHHVSTQVAPAPVYAQFLVDQSKRYKGYQLVNNFYSLTKNRLVMLAITPSEWRYRLKFLLLIPFALMVAGFCILDVASPHTNPSLNTGVLTVDGETVYLAPIKIEWGSIKKEKGVISLRTFKKSCTYPIHLLINEKRVVLEKLEINLLKKNKEVISIQAPAGVINPAQTKLLEQLDGDAEIYLENITIKDDSKTSKRIPNIVFQIKDLRK